MSKEVCIIGNGAWGKALFHVISQNTKNVRIAEKGEVVTEEIIVIAVPTNNIRELAKVIKSPSADPIIINTAKGIEKDTHLLPHEILHDLFPESRYFTLIGPGFAGEVARNMPTLLNLGFGNEKNLSRKILHLFQTDFFRVRSVPAIHVLELSAALKNIYAIGCGLADGLGYETNTRIQLIVLAIEEMQRLFAAQSLSISAQATAGTVGDLILTCNSSESRNFRFGQLLAKQKVQDSLERVKETVEGYYTLQSLEYLQSMAATPLPLAAFVGDVVAQDTPAAVKKRFAEFIKGT
jgi:glycerol-3-phosphate dehydrogenase (NAD(P)+)